MTTKNYNNRSVQLGYGFSARLDAYEGGVLTKWQLSWPLRWYLKFFPISPGKGIVQRFVIDRCMPRGQSIAVTLPCGASLDLSTDERLGQHILINEQFENAELQTCQRAASVGSTAVDVGANVGIFTLTMAAAVGPTGLILAVEPLLSNARRLQSHASRNNFSNVNVANVAAGSKKGSALIDGRADPAFASAHAVEAAATATGGEVRVAMVTLDDLWRENGRPLVSFVKVDVEGTEPDVLAGASEMLATCRPKVLVEAPTPELLASVSKELAAAGLEPTQPRGFAPWNYLFSPRA